MNLYNGELTRMRFFSSIIAAVCATSSSTGSELVNRNMALSYGIRSEARIIVEKTLSVCVEISWSVLLLGWMLFRPATSVRLLLNL